MSASPKPVRETPPASGVLSMWRRLNSVAWPSRSAMTEKWRERRAPYPSDSHHEPHVRAGVDWLCRAQDAVEGGGIARGYALRRHLWLGVQGWEPAYPETTGYIIPTLYAAAEYLGEPDLARRATNAARWEAQIQFTSGAIQGGVIGEKRSPAVFNTGQVLFGWLSAWMETGDSVFYRAAVRAADFLACTQDKDGLWRRENSRFARADATLYNARAAWALAEAGVRLEEPVYRDIAARGLHAVVRRQHADGWLPDCCLNDPDHPLLHTLAYTLEGLLEGGFALADSRLIAGARRGAAAVASLVAGDGRLPGRFARGWRPAVPWVCLTGSAQMACIWLRLAATCAETAWVEPARRVLAFIKGTQNRDSGDPGVRGGIRGSFPIDGGYAPYEVLAWATKFFIDALMRDDWLAGIPARPAPPSHTLA